MDPGNSFDSKETKIESHKRKRDETLSNDEETTESLLKRAKINDTRNHKSRIWENPNVRRLIVKFCDPMTLARLTRTGKSTAAYVTKTPRAQAFWRPLATHVMQQLMCMYGSFCRHVGEELGRDEKKFDLEIPSYYLRPVSDLVANFIRKAPTNEYHRLCYFLTGRSGAIERKESKLKIAHDAAVGTATEKHWKANLHNGASLEFVVRAETREERQTYEVFKYFREIVKQVCKWRVLWNIQHWSFDTDFAEPLGNEDEDEEEEEEEEEEGDEEEEAKEGDETALAEPKPKPEPDPLPSYYKPCTQCGVDLATNNRYRTRNDEIVCFSCWN